MADYGQQTLVLTRWGAKWLEYAWGVVTKGSTKERFTKEVLCQLDAQVHDPIEFVDTHTYTSTHTIHDKNGEVKKEEVVRTKKVIKRGKRSSFSSALAQLAYNKYGERPMSEANILVTRKWLQKQLEEPEYKDMRVCDKNIAVDRAVFLSFVPTNDFRKMKLAVQTKTWKDRCDSENVFGKVFRLVSGGLSGPAEALD
jgi:hypothetical protein